MTHLRGLRITLAASNRAVGPALRRELASISQRHPHGLQGSIEGVQDEPEHFERHYPQERLVTDQTQVVFHSTSRGPSRRYSPSNTSRNRGSARVPIFSTRSALSTVYSCDTLTTLALGRFASPLFN